MAKNFPDLEGKFIIGALHFTPLSGYPGFQGREKTLDIAMEDLQAFEKGGIDGIIIENNYDVPHKIKVKKETVEDMLFLGGEIRKRTKLPIGVSVLWNDYESAFLIAKQIGADFIRVPVFVDSVLTDFGEIHANPRGVIDYRNEIGAQKVKIMADVQVKHATMLRPRPIEESVKDAIAHGADAIIVTGTKTGEPPQMAKVESAKGASGVPILIGSGFEAGNAKELLKYADGAIVSTSLKLGSISKMERNAKDYTLRIDSDKVNNLMEEVRKFSR
ncbi:MAG: BtpA/SgcQ family protein [Candidatus Micrarchaeota archaeon]|nr:BtpA/SgcQ family protein [Candidatus Micrarchaeota archaeon]